MPRMEATAQAQLLIRQMPHFHLCEEPIEKIQGHIGDFGHVAITIPFWQAACTHVSVSNGFNLMVTGF